MKRNESGQGRVQAGLLKSCFSKVQPKELGTYCFIRISRKDISAELTFPAHSLHKTMCPKDSVKGQGFQK